MKSVSYPGLKSHPQHDLARQQMRGFGGMVTIVLKTDLGGTRRFLENTHLFSLAESLGGVESLINHPALMTHASVPKEQREALGVTDSLVRLVGWRRRCARFDRRSRKRARHDLVRCRVDRSACPTAFRRSAACIARDCQAVLIFPPMGNTFGQLFRITTFGESHGGGIGVIIDGCPPKIDISEAEIQQELDRRRPGQSKFTTQRKEEDRCEILSGVFEGKTLGTPIAILVRNKDARPEDYVEIARKFRPSHADFTYEAKYGIRNWQGGGRASARETVGRVAAGAVAKKILSNLCSGVRDRRLRRADS